MTRVRKKSSVTRSVRLNIHTDKILSQYMDTHKGKFNESDLIEEAITCFFKNTECVAKIQFERKLGIKSQK